MSSLRYLLEETLDSSGEKLLINQLWGSTLGYPIQNTPNTYAPYFRHYATECRRLRLGVSKSAWLSTSMAAKMHEDIVFIANELSVRRSEPRSKTRVALQQHFGNPSNLSIDQSIDFALRVWLTMNVRENHLHTPRIPTLQWDEQSTLVEFVARQFPHATTTTSEQLDHTFTAANMQRLSGIEIEWTPCLVDHLRLDKRRRLLKIYPFKQTLLDHLQQESDSSPVIPASVLRETIKSLNLLFPHWDPKTDVFMLQHDHTFHLGGPFEDPAPLCLANFDHWRNRLLELHLVFISPPVGLSQMWADRRNPLQWYTFWLAVIILVLTIVFGIIFSVTGIMQTRVAYLSLKLAQSQVAS